MKYQIENARSGIVLGTYDADTPAQALDLLAKDAGYKDYADAQEVAPAVPGEIVVSEIGTA
ncbi:hypothetical protein NR402_18180 [Acidithiobacillus ferrooxidans]|uniref:hypothetical protein n=1 Tax=Acidithiobacillus ferrooxidans TaxID=920 RepID=UPI00214B63C6|nr:hypothetical protein [Acidithiobacillus ferrooxidans]MCR2832166.1 hypothetical protein [Acidithiobacillus ferrooxidans]